MSRRGPGLKAVGVSLVIHGLVLAPLVALAKPPEPLQFEVIKINLVSPPAEAVQPTPEPAVAQPQPEPEPVAPQPKPEAKAAEPPPPEKKEERPKTEKPPETPRPAPTKPSEKTGTGGENLNIATEGREFPFPEYLNNVIIQVNRYFRWDDDSRPKAVIYFEITQDGSVRGIRLYRSSGNIRFDFAVQGAVETAGNRGAFGPLPDGYAGAFLPVQLEVEPPR